MNLEWANSKRERIWSANKYRYFEEKLTSQLVENMFKAWTTVTDGKYVMVIDHSSQIQICRRKKLPLVLGLH